MLCVFVFYIQREYNVIENGAKGAPDEVDEQPGEECADVHLHTRPGREPPVLTV